MNSAVKPALATGGAQGPASPAKVPLVGQNLTAHGAAAAHPAPSVPSMAPVTPNMAQMAHNMSHHGNLSHHNNAVPVVSPNKTVGAPLSLVADKPVPLALTRTTDKKEPEPVGQSNGTVEQPKPAANAPSPFKPQNNEASKDKQDIAKTSPSTPKPPEKPNTPQKAEQANTAQADGPSQPKVATANEAPEKSPAKPSEPKPAPTADVAPTQSNSKPLPESANDNKVQEKPVVPPVGNIPAATPNSAATANASAATPNANAQAAKPDKVIESAKAEPAPVEKKEDPKPVAPEKPVQNAVEEKKEEPKPEPKVEQPKPVQKEVVQETPKKEAPQKAPTPQKETPTPKPEEKKPEKTAAEKKQEPEKKVTPRSTLKLATVTPAMRKRRQPSPKPSETPPAKKAAAEASPATPDSRGKRNRTKVQLYQSPTPELAMATKLSASAGRSTPTKPGDDKLIVFYKNEYLAVRNAEGGFYVCQAVQNVYRTTRKIKIRWLSQDKALDPKGETYKPDFYDTTDMETVLTTLSLTRAPGGGGAWVLKPAEQARAANILQRAIRAEQGQRDALVSPEHPDGLDLSLYTDESQLEKRSPRKRAAPAGEEGSDHEDGDSEDEPSPPAKKSRGTPKRSPKSAAKPSPKPNNKRNVAGSTPIVASTSKTATALSEKAKAKSTPPPAPAAAKRTPAKKEAKPEAKKEAKPEAKKEAKPAPTPSPVRSGRRGANKEVKPPPAPVPSTSTGKATRTPRKPPANK